MPLNLMSEKIMEDKNDIGIIDIIDYSPFLNR